MKNALIVLAAVLGDNELYTIIGIVLSIIAIIISTYVIISNRKIRKILEKK